MLRQPSAARLCRDRAEPRPGAGSHDGLAFPALAGAARVDKGSVRGSQRDVGGARLADAARDDCRRHDHRRSVLDQEQATEPRPGDAPDQERQSVVFRDEGPHQGRCRLGAGAHGGGTAANEADITQTAALLHGEEEDVFGDAGYTGVDKRPELEDRDISWNIAIKRSIIKALPKALRELAEPVERALSQVRAVVEHPFHIVKNRFRHKKLRYRGLHKNTAQLYTLFALANLVIVKEALLVRPGE